MNAWHAGDLIARLPEHLRPASSCSYMVLAGMAAAATHDADDDADHRGGRRGYGGQGVGVGGEGVGVGGRGGRGGYHMMRWPGWNNGGFGGGPNPAYRGDRRHRDELELRQRWG